MKPVRTRIAPSPTGENLHIGNAYTALINYVFAKKHSGQFIIRIEDTDRTRFVAGSEERILDSLHWLGISYAEGPDKGGQFAPYRQSDRLPLYKEYAEKLISAGHAYYCFCTSDRLEQMRATQEKDHLPPMYDGLCKKIPLDEARLRVQSGERSVIRLNVPDSGEIKFHDEIRGDISFSNSVIDDQVLLKSDGFPTYHLGVVVDDHLMQITHIIRGEEWISSTPKHVLLYKFFGWEPPIFAHMPLLRNPDKSKLSKRKNPVWVSWFREEGYLPQAILNYLATLAWSHPEQKELFTVDEMLQVFDLSQIQTTAPIFNIEKLRWMNGEYIRKMAVSELRDLIYAFYRNRYSKEMIAKVLPLVTERMKTLKEFDTLSDFFFDKPNKFEKPLHTEVINILRSVLENCEWKHDALEQSIREASEKHSIKPKDMFMELRIAITGKTVGPPLLESMELLGKNESLSRLL